MVAFRLTAAIANGRQVVESALSRGLELKQGRQPRGTSPFLGLYIACQHRSPSPASFTVHRPRLHPLALGRPMCHGDVPCSVAVAQAPTTRISVAGIGCVSYCRGFMASGRRGSGCDCGEPDQTKKVEGMPSRLRFVPSVVGDLVLLNFHSQVEAPSQGGNSVE